MLDKLIEITASSPYITSGSLRVKETLIKPWEIPDTTLIFEIWNEDDEDVASEVWKVTCYDLAHTQSIPQFVIPRTKLKLFDQHPLLWNFDDEIYFSIRSKTDHIAKLMGELFIEHTKACGNWVDFQWLYSSLPTTLETLRENQLAIPVPLKNACFDTLEKYGIKYQVNSVQQKPNEYKVLFFSNSDIWPDEENFKQPYIIAKEFSENKLS